MINWDILKDEFNKNSQQVFLWLKDEFNKISSSRINPNIFNNLKINAYGSFLPLIQLANIQMVDARQLIIKPFDKSLLKEIVKALIETKQHLTPQINPDSIRIIFSPITEEIRRENVKNAKLQFEKAKEKIRIIRQSIQIKYKKNSDINKEQISYYEEQLNKLTKEINVQLENLFKQKENNLLSI